MTQASKLKYMHARNTGLFKGKDLAKGEEVFIENLPCEILPVTVEPSGGMSARIMARFSDGKMDRLGYARDIRVKEAKTMTLVVIDYTKVGNYSTSYWVLATDGFDREEALAFLQEKRYARTRKGE